MICGHGLDAAKCPYCMRRVPAAQPVFAIGDLVVGTTARRADWEHEKKLGVGVVKGYRRQDEFADPAAQCYIVQWPNGRVSHFGAIDLDPAPPTHIPKTGPPRTCIHGHINPINCEHCDDVGYVKWADEVPPPLARFEETEREQHRHKHDPLSKGHVGPFDFRWLHSVGMRV